MIDQLKIRPGNGITPLIRNAQPIMDQSKGMVVIKNNGRFVHIKTSILLMETVSSRIPWSDTGPLVLQDVCILKPRRPIIEIKLIAELPVLVLTIAPVDTLFPPPRQGIKTNRISFKDHHLDIVNAGNFLKRIVGRRITMLNEKN